MNLAVLTWSHCFVIKLGKCQLNVYDW